MLKGVVSLDLFDTFYKELQLTRRILVSALALVALVLLAAPSPADTFRVRMTGTPGTFKYTPDFKHISKGDKIVWKNRTSYTHTVTAYKGPWSKNTSVPAGERTGFRFKRNGAYYYRCTQPGHSSLNGSECNGMCGQIHVQ